MHCKLQQLVTTAGNNSLAGSAATLYSSAATQCSCSAVCQCPTHTAPTDAGGVAKKFLVLRLKGAHHQYSVNVAAAGTLIAAHQYSVDVAAAGTVNFCWLHGWLLRTLSVRMSTSDSSTL
jgi:hypothetical protein